MQKEAIPDLPVGTSKRFFFFRQVWFSLWGGRFPIIGKDGITVGWSGKQYEISGTRPRGGSDSTEQWPPTLYDEAEAYSVGAWVWVKKDSTIATTGLLDADSDETVTAIPGLWRCVQDTGSPAGDPLKYHPPQSPMPTADDPTNANVYWVLVQETSFCL